MVVNPSSPCTLSTASFNVLQSTGTRTTPSSVVFVSPLGAGTRTEFVVVVVEETGMDVFVSPATDTDDGYTRTTPTVKISKQLINRTKKIRMEEETTEKNEEEELTTVDSALVVVLI